MIMVAITRSLAALAVSAKGTIFRHVTAHSGHPWNEAADRVAATAANSDMDMGQPSFWSYALPRAQSWEIDLVSALVEGQFDGSQYPPRQGTVLFPGFVWPIQQKHRVGAIQITEAVPARAAAEGVDATEKTNCRMRWAALQANVLTLGTKKAEDWMEDRRYDEGRYVYCNVANFSLH